MNKSFVRVKVCKNHSLLRRLSKLKKALFIPISVKKNASIAESKLGLKGDINEVLISLNSEKKWKLKANAYSKLCEIRKP